MPVFLVFFDSLEVFGVLRYYGELMEQRGQCKLNEEMTMVAMAMW